MRTLRVPSRLAVFALSPAANAFLKASNVFEAAESSAIANVYVTGKAAAGRFAVSACEDKARGACSRDPLGLSGRSVLTELSRVVKRPRSDRYHCLCFFSGSWDGGFYRVSWLIRLGF